jgi:hypothetical protein
MSALEESPAVRRQKYGFVLALFLLLMVLAHAAAELMGAIAPGGHTVVHHRVVLTIWVTLILLTPALCFHVLARHRAPNSYWRAFWTFAYLAFLAHVCWTVFGTFHGNVAEIFHSRAGVATDPEKIVRHPWADFVLTAWWALDVLLAWLVSDDQPWVRAERGAVHLLAFVMFFGAAVLADRAGMATRGLGVLMALAVVGSLALRLITRESDPKSLPSLLFIAAFQLLNRLVSWHRLPIPLALGNLWALREVLRAKNLHDTSAIAVTDPIGVRETVPFDPVYLSEREEDGQWNDLYKPAMGNASLNPNDPLNGPEFTLSNPGARFGRNIPLHEVDLRRDGDLLDPSPRLVSNRLLARPRRSDGADDFKPATIINLLAAAWIQFQVHDWFNHGAPRPIDDDPFDVPLPPGDDWPEPRMLVRRTRADPTRRPDDGAGPVTFVNAETHWWDSSQIYGDSRQACLRYRSGQDGKLRIDPRTRLLPVDPTGVEATGATSNWWLGLAVLHNLFTLEHNAICDHLLQAFPAWRDREDRDDVVFRAARLINNALMAKIHTVEWTPAILTHPAVAIGMNANWWGLATERVKKAFGRISPDDVISGIPGSATDHHGADYCLTEEFAAVYRLHPLLPNAIQILSHEDGKPGRVLKFQSDDPKDPDLILGPNAMANALRDGTQLADVLYTFGVHSPGAVTLRNFPNWMRRLRRRNGQNVEELIDLAAVDVLRDRERGVPRYNRFRELFHKSRVTSFEQMTDDPELARTLSEVYGHPDKVDLMVGLYAEKPPEGFGVSDTAFRVFLLMASRRLKSDRLFTSDYTPEVYTRPGMDWIENNTMRTVLLRHFPELTPALQRAKNAFAPWK